MTAPTVTQIIAYAAGDGPIPDDLAETVALSYGIEWDTEIEIRFTANPVGECACKSAACAVVDYMTYTETGKPSARSQEAMDNGPDGMITEHEHRFIACPDCLQYRVAETLTETDRLIGITITINPNIGA